MTLPVHVGIDASRRNDSTAVVIAQNQGERIAVRARFWQHPPGLSDEQLAAWHIPMGEVEAYLRQIALTYPEPAATDDKGRRITGPAFLYDPMFFSRSADALEAEGLNMLEVPSVDARWIPIAKAFYESIVTGVLAHNGDAVLASHIRNVARVEKPGGWTMNKRDPNGRKKTDGAMACAMAVSHAMQFQAPAPTSKYEKSQLLVL